MCSSHHCCRQRVRLVPLHGDYEVDLVPVFRTRVHPGGFLTIRCFENCVGDDEVVLCAERHSGVCQVFTSPFLNYIFLGFLRGGVAGLNTQRI